MNEFRDLTRDNFCDKLLSLGLIAQLSLRGRPEEGALRSFSRPSVGIIDIKGELIRWVNIRYQAFSTEENPKPIYFADFGVPDPRVDQDFPQIKIKTTFIKTFPIFGEVRDLIWKGKDYNLGIISSLNSDDLIKESMIESYTGIMWQDNDINIASSREYGCWIITTNLKDNIDVIYNEWICYRLIARRLLEYKIPNS